MCFCDGRVFFHGRCAEIFVDGKNLLFAKQKDMPSLGIERESLGLLKWKKPGAHTDTVAPPGQFGKATRAIFQYLLAPSRHVPDPFECEEMLCSNEDHR